MDKRTHKFKSIQKEVLNQPVEKKVGPMGIFSGCGIHPPQVVRDIKTVLCCVITNMGGFRKQSAGDTFPEFGSFLGGLKQQVVLKVLSLPQPKQNKQSL